MKTAATKRNQELKEIMAATANSKKIQEERMAASRMNREDFAAFNRAAINGSIPDEKNPIFVLQAGLSNEMLSKIAKGEINVQDLAKRILECRGCDANGTWVGLSIIQ